MMKHFSLSVLFCLFFCFAFSQKKITLEDIWEKRTFTPRTIASIRSLLDGEHYTVLTKSGIEKYKYKTGQKTGYIIRFDEIPFLEDQPSSFIENYQFDAKEEKIILFADMTPLYRRSYTAEVYLYDLKTKQFTHISKAGKIRLIEFSPDGTKTAYVRDNNIYVMDLNTFAEVPVTTDGKWNHIINGTTDWVYEEELDITKGIYWSPDNKKIAFYRFDESQVKEFSMTLWGELYPGEYKYKYPKAGENNSIVDILVYDLEKKETKTLDLNSEQDQYLPRMQWTKEADVLAVMKLNRLQNELNIWFVNCHTGSIHSTYIEKNDSYIDVPSEWFFMNDKKHFIITSESDGYNHMYLYDFINKTKIQIDKGNYDVAEICGIDEKKNTIYYLSSETSPLNKELYSIQLNGSKKTKISKRTGTHKATFSESYQYYVNEYSEANTPPIYTINNTKGDIIHVLEDNLNLKTEISRFGEEKKEFGVLATASGQELNYWLIKPADFDSTKKYPVLFYVYGGPGSQTVVNRWGGNDYFWFKMLAQKGYICISVDGRGTGNRGEEFKKVTYKSLGLFEVQDQIEAAQYFGKLSWVDTDRIGIYGWSFGGYMSSLCITVGAEYFKTAIAVAPVTTWRYYDNIYTERFMQRPVDNETGYDAYSPIRFTDLLKGNYLLIHGTADDNVHFQNAVDLSTALIKSGKQFDQFFYPNKNHFLIGGNTRLHLFTLMTEYLEKKL